MPVSGALTDGRAAEPGPARRSTARRRRALGDRAGRDAAQACGDARRERRGLRRTSAGPAGLDLELGQVRPLEQVREPVEERQSELDVARPSCGSGGSGGG